MAATLGKMHWSSLASAAKILPQGQDLGFQVSLPEPMTLAKRYLQGIWKNTGENSVSIQPQSAPAATGPWTNIGAPTTVVAKAEKQITIAIPAEAVYWRIQGTGLTDGIVMWAQADASHTNAGLP